MITRIQMNAIKKYLFKKKVIIVYGARQVGKTTLLKNLQQEYPEAVYYNCDEWDTREALTHKTSTELKSFFGNKKLILLDEAQQVPDIGITLKLIIDTFPETQIIATGSSSFDLANATAEPLTGRKYEFSLYPFSVEELIASSSEQETARLLERRMIFGMYPEMVTVSGDEEKRLKTLVESYLYKDILSYEHMKKPDMLRKLLQLLALQIGAEVSLNELSQTLGIDKNTVSRYIDILEKSFIIFSLPSFARNIRNEIKKSRKIYFVDTGVRNALINNYNPLSLRTDTGALFENFLISERIKWNHYNNKHANLFFWRTHTQKEIDFLEEYGGKLYGYECKWSKEKGKIPQEFLNAYPQTSIAFIHKKNFLDFVLGKV